MVIRMLGALLIAFAASYFFGKRYVPWLKEHGYVQPLKDDVKQKVYLE